jgi:hypothetical protein
MLNECCQRFLLSFESSSLPCIRDGCHFAGNPSSGQYLGTAVPAVFGIGGCGPASAFGRWNLGSRGRMGQSPGKQPSAVVPSRSLVELLSSPLPQ